jgi:hypothetical protein
MDLIDGISHKEVVIPRSQTVMGGDLDSLVLSAAPGDAEPYPPQRQGETGDTDATLAEPAIRDRTRPNNYRKMRRRGF